MSEINCQARSRMTYSTFMTRLYLGDGDSEICFKQWAGEVQDIDK